MTFLIRLGEWLAICGAGYLGLRFSVWLAAGHQPRNHYWLTSEFLCRVSDPRWNVR